MVRRILPIHGPPHDDRHLLHRTLAPEAPVRKHHHAGMQWWWSPSWTEASAKRFEAHHANPHKRTTEFPHPEERRSTAKTIRWSIASRPGTAAPKLEHLPVANLPLHHHHNNGGNTNTKTLNGEITIGGKSEGHRPSSKSHRICFHRFRVDTLATVVHATGAEDRTPRRTHTFLSVVSVSHLWPRTCVWLRTCLGRVAHLRALKVIHWPHPSSTTPRHAWRFSIILFNTISFHIDSTAYDWNQETLLRHPAKKIAVWPSGWINSSHTNTTHSTHSNNAPHAPHAPHAQHATHSIHRTPRHQDTKTPRDRETSTPIHQDTKTQKQPHTTTHNNDTTTKQQHTNNTPTPHQHTTPHNNASTTTTTTTATTRTTTTTQCGKALFLHARSFHPTLESWITLSRQYVAQPNPSHPGSCRQDTTIRLWCKWWQWTMENIWKRKRKKKKKKCFSEKWKNEETEVKNMKAVTLKWAIPYPLSTEAQNRIFKKESTAFQWEVLGHFFFLWRPKRKTKKKHEKTKNEEIWKNDKCVFVEYVQSFCFQTQNPRRFTGFVVVVVILFDEILDDFHVLFQKCVFVKKKTNNQFWGLTVCQRKGDFFWTCQKDTHFSDENWRTCSLLVPTSLTIIILQEGTTAHTQNTTQHTNDTTHTHNDTTHNNDTTATRNGNTQRQHTTATQQHHTTPHQQQHTNNNTQQKHTTETHNNNAQHHTPTHTHQHTIALSNTQWHTLTHNINHNHNNRNTALQHTSATTHNTTIHITTHTPTHIRWLITIWCTSSFQCLKRWQCRMRKQQWTRNGRSSKRIQAGSWTKLRVKKEVTLGAQRDKKKVHFATLMDLCHLKNAELEPNFQKYKRRVVLKHSLKSLLGWSPVQERGTWISWRTVRSMLTNCLKMLALGKIR